MSVVAERGARCVTDLSTQMSVKSNHLDTPSWTLKSVAEVYGLVMREIHLCYLYAVMGEGLELSTGTL
jgi:hypothetical protein